MSKPYLIQLYPAAPFLFGGEYTFGEGTAPNYLARSETWPQQTSLLGMLRYQLLVHHNLLPLNRSNNRSQAANRIGPESFGLGRANTFGDIDALSPVFLMHGNTPYRPTPTDTTFTEKDDVVTFAGTLEPGHTLGRVWTGRQVRGQIPTLTAYDHKTHYAPCLTDAGGQSVRSQDAVFKKRIQVGIRKDPTGQAQTNAFFKKEVIQFPASDWSFALIAHLKTALPNALVTIGAEQSLFRMKVVALPDAGFDFDSYESCFGLQTDPTHARLELLSDAYVLPDVYDHCTLAYTDTTSFRSLLTTVDQTKPYHNRPDKSTRLELLARGSVLWSTNPAGTLEAITRHADFGRIGYNAVHVGPALSFTQTH